MQNFEKAGVAPFIDARLGDAHELVRQLPGPFDFVFSDADKDWYLQYFKDLEPKIAPGGCFTAHNVLRSGGGGAAAVPRVREEAARTTRRRSRPAAARGSRSAASGAEPAPRGGHRGGGSGTASQIPARPANAGRPGSRRAFLQHPLVAEAEGRLDLEHVRRGRGEQPVEAAAHVGVAGGVRVLAGLRPHGVERRARPPLPPQNGVERQRLVVEIGFGERERPRAAAGVDRVLAGEGAS